MPIDLSNAWQSGTRIVNFVISLLPNIILSVIIFVIFLLLASAAKALVRRLTQRHGRRQSLGILIGHLAHISVLIFGFLVAFSAVAPSFHASDLIKMLGVGSVAIGSPSPDSTEGSRTSRRERRSSAPRTEIGSSSRMLFSSPIL